MHQIFLCVDAPTYSAGLMNSSSDAFRCLQALVFLSARASKRPPVPRGLCRCCCPLGPVSVDVLSVCLHVHGWVHTRGHWAPMWRATASGKLDFFSSLLLLVVGAQRQ